MTFYEGEDMKLYHLADTESNEDARLPCLSIIVPVYNEEKFIKECLSSLVSQDYPEELVEILVIDGMSTDKTSDIVQWFCNQYPYIRMLKNPRRITATSLNVGIKESRGEIIIRVDGHSSVSPDYFKRIVECFSKIGADCVGGPMNAVGTSFVSKAIALATTSRFGIGNSQFHYAKKEGWADTVYLGAYRRGVFNRIGLFDEEESASKAIQSNPLLGKARLRWCSEDWEFNCRLQERGGKIYFSPQIRSRYYNRSSLMSLWQQYFRYGFWKVRIMQQHFRRMKPRHFVPSLFVSGLIGGGLLALFFQPFYILFCSLMACYLIASFSFSVNICRKAKRYAFVLPLFFATLHLSYGSGFLFGLLYFIPKRFKR